MARYLHYVSYDLPVHAMLGKHTVMGKKECFYKFYGDSDAYLLVNRGKCQKGKYVKIAQLSDMDILGIP